MKEQAREKLKEHESKMKAQRKKRNEAKAKRDTALKQYRRKMETDLMEKLEKEMND